MIKKFCPKCNYEWLPRVSKAKRCPRCGKWLEWSAKNGNDKKNLPKL
jgi:ssDNA-binding Zn-finger/Zn-ribbon topoisomerase 1